MIVMHVISLFLYLYVQKITRYILFMCIYIYNYISILNMMIDGIHIYIYNEYDDRSSIDRKIFG